MTKCCLLFNVISIQATLRVTSHFQCRSARRLLAWRLLLPGASGMLNQWYADSGRAAVQAFPHSLRPVSQTSYHWPRRVLEFADVLVQYKAAVCTIVWLQRVCVRVFAKMRQSLWQVMGESTEDSCVNASFICLSLSVSPLTTPCFTDYVYMHTNIQLIQVMWTTNYSDCSIFLIKMWDMPILIGL